MSDPNAMEQNLTGMLPNGSFSDDREDPSSGEGDDVQTDGIQIEGEPDPGPEADVELQPPGRWQPLARRARGAGRTMRRGTRRLRGRLPRGWPGARRWTDL